MKCLQIGKGLDDANEEKSLEGSEESSERSAMIAVFHATSLFWVRRSAIGFLLRRSRPLEWKDRSYLVS